MQDYLTAKEAAEYMGVAEITLSVWRQKNKGPEFAKRDFGQVRIFYKREVLEQFKRDNMGGA